VIGRSSENAERDDQQGGADIKAERPGETRDFFVELLGFDVAVDLGWPLRSGDPFTDRMNSLPKFVVSTTLQEPFEWNSTLLEGDVVDAVAELKEQPGEDILIYGSAALVNTLLPHSLIDEYGS
jgi:RibD C-terminal domain